MGEGKTCLYTHVGGAKVLFSYVNLQATDPVGGAKPFKIFHVGENAPVHPCKHVSGTSLKQIVLLIDTIACTSCLRLYLQVRAAKCVFACMCVCWYVYVACMLVLQCACVRTHGGGSVCVLERVRA